MDYKPHNPNCMIVSTSLSRCEGHICSEKEAVFLGEVGFIDVSCVTDAFFSNRHFRNVRNTFSCHFYHLYAVYKSKTTYSFHTLHAIHSRSRFCIPALYHKIGYWFYLLSSLILPVVSGMLPVFMKTLLRFS